MPRLGILALQGCIEPHIKHLEHIGVDARLVRYPQDCQNLDGYIIPGGESTTMLKLIKTNGLHEVLQKDWETKPVWGICAGAILIGKKVSAPQQFSYGLIDYHIARNAYGSQVMSKYGNINGYEVAFIRAPKITICGAGIEVLAMHESSPVWVRNNNAMATTFHPELNQGAPSPMHKYFIDNFF